MKKFLIFILLFLVLGSSAFASEIHQAVMVGDLAKVKAILDQDPKLVNSVEDGITPVLYAAYQENKKMVRFLLSRGAQDNIFVATIIGDSVKVKSFLNTNPSLVNAKDHNGQTPLHWAANKGHIQIVKFLVSQGAQVTLKDNTGWTPLEYAEEMKKRNVVHYLRQHGAR
ncbi:MAG: hypothetical protein C0407_08275 [Desulfobacca sp.]|nr:hypothetical protein [Desulfobacca sp.]